MTRYTGCLTAPLSAECSATRGTPWSAALSAFIKTRSSTGWRSSSAATTNISVMCKSQKNDPEKRARRAHDALSTSLLAMDGFWGSLVGRNTLERGVGIFWYSLKAQTGVGIGRRNYTTSDPFKDFYGRTHRTKYLSTMVLVLDEW